MTASAATFFLRSSIAILSVALLAARPASAASTGDLLDKSFSELTVDDVLKLAGDLEGGWQRTAELRLGLGWDSNLLLSSVDRRESVFCRTSFEGMLWRPAWLTHRVEWIGYVSATHRRMFNPRSLPDDSEAFFHGEARWQAAAPLRLSALVQSYYLDTVLDLSTESERMSLPLTAAGLVGGAAARWESSRGWWLEAGATGTRSGVRDIPEDFDERRQSLRIGVQSAGGRRGAMLGWRVRERWYAQRNTTAIGGRPIPGTRLIFHLPEMEAKVEGKSQWHGEWSFAVAGHSLRNRDNGSGFFNYRLRRLSAEIGWTLGPWTVETEFTGSRYRWDVQLAGVGIDPPRRLRTDRETDLRITRRTGEGRFWYLDVRRECVAANDPSSSYNVTVASAGFGWNL